MTGADPRIRLVGPVVGPTTALLCRGPRRGPPGAAPGWGPANFSWGGGGVRHHHDQFAWVGARFAGSGRGLAGQGETLDQIGAVPYAAPKPNEQGVAPRVPLPATSGAY